MTLTHSPHRRVPRDAGGRSQARLHGAPASRSHGRELCLSVPLPAVRGIQYGGFGRR